MKKILYFSLVFVFLCLSGCSDRRDLAPGKLQVFSGGEQLAGCGEKCELPLMVGVIAQGSGSKTVKGIRLRMLPDEKGGEVEPVETRTDEGGKAAFSVTLAKSFGDQYFTVTAPDYPSVEPLYVHFVAGVKVSNARQEAIAGERLAHPMGVTITNEEGKPLVDIPVFFSLKSGDKNARLSGHRVLTDANGTATVDFQTTDNFTGKYEILAEIGEGQYQTRGIVIEQLAISRMNVILGVLAGLGFFIFGMTMMSDGLQQAAGDRLKNLLQMFTGNRFKAMLAGVVVTALVQSSSACSVMVIGFVNASLLNLTQAIGILLGSSIGTTVTAQIISFKLDFLSLPAIAIGVLWMLCAKKSQSKALGSTILGFGVLFFGMSLMSAN